LFYEKRLKSPALKIFKAIFPLGKLEESYIKPDKYPNLIANFKNQRQLEQARQKTKRISQNILYTARQPLNAYSDKPTDSSASGLSLCGIE
jgi:hypothetical protein